MTLDVMTIELRGRSCRASFNPDPGGHRAWVGLVPPVRGLPEPETDGGNIVSTRNDKRFLPEAGDGGASITIFAETFPKIPALVGHGTRCGKPRCRCTRGELHRTQYLRWREGAVQRRRYVQARDVPRVRAILERRRARRQQERLDWLVAAASLRELARLIEGREAQMRAEGVDA